MMRLRFSLAASLLAGLPCAHAVDPRPRRLGRGDVTSASTARGGPVASEPASAALPTAGMDTSSMVMNLVRMQAAGKTVQGAAPSGPTDLGNKCNGAAGLMGGVVEGVLEAAHTCIIAAPPNGLMSLQSLSSVQSAEPVVPMSVPEDADFATREKEKRKKKQMSPPAGPPSTAGKKFEEMKREELQQYTDSDEGISAAAATTLWGLDRVNQCLGDDLDGDRTRLSTPGIRVYVLDTGVKKSHSALTSQMGPEDCHFSFFSDEPAQTDEHGHGTHVAGTACSELYGVADCEVCSVKVLSNSGSGSSASVAQGLDFVLDQCKADANGNGGRPCVVNMSLGGNGTPQEDGPFYNIIKDLTENGVVMVVAAGNSANDSCGLNPAGHPDCLTVGATQEDPVDSPASFTSFGSCTEIYAPGKDIVSADASTASGSVSFSGTSMASPHVAGLAAFAMWERVDADLWTPTKESAEAIKDILVNNAHQTTTFLPATNPDARIVVANSEGDCPSLAPTASPVPLPPCAGTRNTRLTLKTDNYPGETSWKIVDRCGSNFMREGDDYGEANNVYTEDFELPCSEYEITFKDEYGDGICCSFGQGYWEVSWENNVLADGGEFAEEETASWGECPPPPTEAPVSASPVTQPPHSPPPTPPPSAGDDSGNHPPAIVIAQANTFVYTASPSCFQEDASLERSYGTTAGQCAQACSVLSTCPGFEVFRTAVGVHEEGECVLMGTPPVPDQGSGCVPMWYYDRDVDGQDD